MRTPLSSLPNASHQQNFERPNLDWGRKSAKVGVLEDQLSYRKAYVAVQFARPSLQVEKNSLTAKNWP
jgi:hypothetical protein